MTVHSISFEQDVVDQRHLRQALGRFATGVTVITTRTVDGKLEGLTANSFSAVSLDPPLVLWSLRQNAPSLKNFQNAGYFAVNVLAADQSHLSRHFATPAEDKFAATAHGSGLGGCPVLHDVLAELRMLDRAHGGRRRPHHLHRPRSPRHLSRRRAADLQRRALLHPFRPRRSRLIGRVDPRRPRRHSAEPQGRAAQPKPGGQR